MISNKSRNRIETTTRELERAKQNLTSKEIKVKWTYYFEKSTKPEPA